MKIFLCTLLALLAASNSKAGTPPCVDSASLAAAYAEAFKCSGRLPVTIVYQDAEQAEVIKDVITIKAVDGTLLITGTSGSRQILDAARVVKITDN